MKKTAAEAEQHYAAFAEKWDSRYPSIVKSWPANWTRVVPMFGFPDDIRQAVYTTDAIELLNISLRKVIKTRAYPMNCINEFPSSVGTCLRILAKHSCLTDAQHPWTITVLLTSSQIRFSWALNSSLFADKPRR